MIRSQAGGPLLSLGLLALAAGCAEPLVDPARAAIVGGMDNPGDPAVVPIVYRRLACHESAQVVCTGVLISPRVVLTAAHCLREQGGRGRYEVYFGSPLDGDPQGRFVMVTGAVSHPGWNDTTHELDLALLRLGEVAPSPTVALPGATLQPTVGQSARIVGYGVTGPGEIPDGIRRQATMMVSEVSPTLLKLVPAPGNSCAGDSGGPVLVDLGSGEQLIGVTASGDPLCTVNAVSARLDGAIADFVTPYLAASAGAPTGLQPAAVPLDALCTKSCSSDADCPAALLCDQPTPTEPARCGTGGHPPGNLGAACDSDTQCPAGDFCARLWDDGADACRCSRPCGDEPTPLPPPGSTGCSLSSSMPLPPWACALFGALALLALRPRRRR